MKHKTFVGYSFSKCKSVKIRFSIKDMHSCK